MFSDPVDEPVASPSPMSEDAQERGHARAVQLLPDQIREIIRLFQCPICSRLLRDPITLPCGRSLCKTCLPPTHVRTNISYPATVNRLHGIACPFMDCQREHAIADFASDIVLKAALTNARMVFEKARDDDMASRSAVEVRTKDEWAIAGISSLRPPEPPHFLRSGHLLATYTLAEMGELDYGVEASYTTALETDDGRAFEAAVLEQVKETVRTEMDCQICYAMYYDPFTTPCGHTFCRHCLQRALDLLSRCPFCRGALCVSHISSRSSPPNLLVQRVTTAFWSDELESRKRAVRAEHAHEGSDCKTPIFVCTLSFPTMPTFLHVFEPRYRLMIRRVLESNRTFGMVIPRHPIPPGGPSFAELGTLLRITNIEFFPDGRSVLESVGVSRFRIIQAERCDGYVVAKTEKINDIGIDEEEEIEAQETRRDDTAQTHGGDTGDNAVETRTPTAPISKDSLNKMPTRELMEFAADFVRRMNREDVNWLTVRILGIFGECPSDPALFPWWLASLLPLKEEAKYRLLATTSVRQRLKICCEWILEWERRRWSFRTCSVM